jgi:hypothetical protein
MEVLGWKPILSAGTQNPKRNLGTSAHSRDWISSLDLVNSGGLKGLTTPAFCRCNDARSLISKEHGLSSCSRKFNDWHVPMLAMQPCLMDVLS